ncbi:MAG: transposase [Betaproteobacteria bacterium]|nr:transposase [Betaproteobacteria bacterium]
MAEPVEAVPDQTPEARVLQTRGGGFPADIFKRRRRSGQACVPALAEMVVRGVPTRKVPAIAGEPRGASFSKPTAGASCAGPELRVGASGGRWLGGAYPRAGRCPAHQEPARRSCGFARRAGRLRHPRRPSSRTVAATRRFRGGGRQRCRAHPVRDVRGQCGARHRAGAAAAAKPALRAPDLAEAGRSPPSARPRRRPARKRSPGGAVAVTASPGKHRGRLRATGGRERPNEEIRRRGRAIRIFPDDGPAPRLTGRAVALGMHGCEMSCR